MAVTETRDMATELQERRQLSAAVADAEYDAGATFLTLFDDFSFDPRVATAQAALAAFDAAHPDVRTEYIRRDDAQLSRDTADDI